MTTQEKNKLDYADLFDNFKQFENMLKKEFSDKKFLKQEIKVEWQMCLENARLILCLRSTSEFVWHKKQGIVSISSDDLELIGDKIDGIDEAKAYYGEIFKNKQIETIVVNKITNNDSFCAENYEALFVFVYDKNCSESFQFFVRVMLCFLEKCITDLNSFKELISVC